MTSWTTSSPPGRITPGAVLLMLGLAGAAWFAIHPAEERAGLACLPVSAVSRWLVGEDAPDSLWAQKINDLAARFAEGCPEPFGVRAAALADQARTTAHRTLQGIQAVTHRQIQAVPSAERLTIAGIGEARLLGVRVLPEQRESALAYLRGAVAGKRLAVAVAKEQDPDRRPLVTVFLENGASVNASLLQRHLAMPWTIPGPWHAWAARPPASPAAPQ
jgi:hypothetical protein